VSNIIIIYDIIVSIYVVRFQHSNIYRVRKWELSSNNGDADKSTKTAILTAADTGPMFARCACLLPSLRYVHNIPLGDRGTWAKRTQRWCYFFIVSL